jgi:hypothetical protein
LFQLVGSLIPLVTQDIIAIFAQGTGGAIAAIANTIKKTDFVRIVLLIFLQILLDSMNYAMAS